MKRFDIRTFLINLGITAMFSLAGIGLFVCIATLIYKMFQYNLFLGIAGIVWWVCVVALATYFTMKEDK